MKLLKRVLLIHWHYFDIEEIEFDQLNFLTGQNASGKSTLIDAMQLVLLGDTSGGYFNKSAGGRTNRTLKGYLLGELGDDEASGFRYLRNGRFTSYIALEFHDQEKNRDFTAGICFDIYSEGDIPRTFFLYDGPLDPQRFLRDRTPMDIRALKAHLKQSFPGHHKVTETGRDFRAELYGKLGGLRERFGTLLKKAVSFNPDVDLQKFITEFVCDVQQPVDVTHMQENIRSYKLLEAESGILQERTELLGRVVATAEEYETQKQNERLYSYLIDRAGQSIREDELTQAKADLTTLKAQLELWQAEEESLSRELQGHRLKRDELMIQQNRDSAALAIDRIEARIRQISDEIRLVQSRYQSTTSLLNQHFREWDRTAKSLTGQLRTLDETLFPQLVAARLQDLATLARRTEEALEPVFSLPVGDYGKIDGAMAARLGETTGQLQQAAQSLRERIRDLAEETQDSLKAKRSELADLEKGIFPFPREAVDLKDAIHSRLLVETGQDVMVRIAAEAADIRDERWRNAIEGYLHTQKYYLLVSPEYFALAARIYDEIKHIRRIYGTGIVDLDKLQRQSTPVQPGSLAEEIMTEEPLARAFFDHALGQVRKCETVGELRQHRTAITEQGMLYSSFVVRALNPDRWSRPAIGQGARQLRMEALRRELAGLESFRDQCQALLAVLDQGAALELIGSREWSLNLEVFQSWAGIPAREGEIQALEETRRSIDTSELDRIRAKIREVESAIQAGERTMRDLGKRIGRASSEQKALQLERIPGLETAIGQSSTAISETYAPEWIEAEGQPRYLRELASRGQPQLIAGAFPREQSRARNARQGKWDDLVELRRKYNDIYKMGYDIKSEDHSIYEDAWLELSENRLPQFLTRIQDARTKAFEQFQEDFLSRLQNNITTARRQIDELNHALKGASFGEDVYRFRMVPRPEYKRYYDMIVDEMLVQGYSLLSESFNAKYRDEINDLFSLITLADAGGQGSQEVEKRVQEFTDYRTYLTFDLEVESPDGSTQRLSRTLGKKSGGETQTPFYIAVLASFAQLYRTGRDQQNSSRLIIFDEAFSKMDGARIIQSIELLRRFNFQVILSAPPDKVADIAPLVDRNLCVFRRGSNTSIQSFGKDQLGVVYES